MEEQLITFETAKLAKEKGFSINTTEYWEYQASGPERYKFITEDSPGATWVNDDLKNRICISTQSLLQRWLREKKEIYIHIAVWRNMDHCDEFTSIITKPAYIKPLYDKSNKGLDIMESKAVAFKHTYEEALEAGLQEGLKLLSNEF